VALTTRGFDSGIIRQTLLQAAVDQKSIKAVTDYRPTLYPETVEAARLDIHWHIGGDYSVHYVEHATDGTQWECRWDRHPEVAGRKHILHQTQGHRNPQTSRRITAIC
jgi:hypothetical protein